MTRATGVQSKSHVQIYLFWRGAGDDSDLQDRTSATASTLAAAGPLSINPFSADMILHLSACASRSACRENGFRLQWQCQLYAALIYVQCCKLRLHQTLRLAVVVLCCYAGHPRQQ
jgi:hypothetical protein